MRSTCRLASDGSMVVMALSQVRCPLDRGRQRTAILHQIGVGMLARPVRRDLHCGALSRFLAGRAQCALNGGALPFWVVLGCLPADSGPVFGVFPASGRAAFPDGVALEAEAAVDVRIDPLQGAAPGAAGPLG